MIFEKLLLRSEKPIVRDSLKLKRDQTKSDQIKPNQT